MKKRTIALIAGINYLVIFVAAMYANFSVLDSLKTNPLPTVEMNPFGIKLAAIAFIVAAISDVIVAWALNELYKEHIFSSVSTYFRIIHATIMAAAVYALLPIVSLNSELEILSQVTTFNNLWLIGLMFFGVHLLLLGKIIKDVKYIPWILMIAGAMYIIDTCAHFLMTNYTDYETIFLTLVAVPAILGEMSYTIWLLVKGGKSTSLANN